MSPSSQFLAQCLSLTDAERTRCLDYLVFQKASLWQRVWPRRAEVARDPPSFRTVSRVPTYSRRNDELLLFPYGGTI